MWVFFLLVPSLLLIDPSTGSQAFGKIHPGFSDHWLKNRHFDINRLERPLLRPGLSDRHAMELHFDINRDGKISLEEEELGHQHPAEFDAHMRPSFDFKHSKEANSINVSIEDFKQVNVVINLLEIFDGGFVHLSMK